MRNHREDADRHDVPEPLRALDRTLEAMFRDPDRERAELTAIRAALVDEAREADPSVVIPLFGGVRRPARRTLPVGWAAEPVERTRAAVASLVARLPGAGSVAALQHPENIRRVVAACVAGFLGLIIFYIGLSGSDPSGSGSASAPEVGVPVPVTPAPSAPEAATAEQRVPGGGAPTTTTTTARQTAAAPGPAADHISLSKAGSAPARSPAAPYPDASSAADFDLASHEHRAARVRRGVRRHRGELCPDRDRRARAV
jgi:hypothetical protein